MEKVKLGFAMCGSFCTFKNAIDQLENLVALGYDIVPIMSESAYSTDTKFGEAKGFRDKIKKICSKKIIKTINDAEPIGPSNLTDIMLVCPCTGNTLSKMFRATTDTSVTMAVKSHLRRQKPVLLALATNDALGASAKNIGHMLNVKNIFFVPMEQDDPINKPNSLVAKFSLIPEALDCAIKKMQMYPLIV